MQEILGDPSTVYLQLSQGKNVKNVMSHESVHVVIETASESQVHLICDLVL